jgi:single-strand DNA-binding protein
MTALISGVGRIGKDAVTRRTQKDEAVTGFSLAMDNGFGDNKQTLWFDCSGWGKRYESVATYLTKGAQVFVMGELGEREHEGKTYKTIRLSTLDLVGGKRDDASSAHEGRGHKPAGKPQAARGESAPAGSVDDEEIIPF